MSLIPGPGRGGGEWHLSILLNVRILEVCFASSSVLCYELEPLHCSLSSTDYLGARASPQLLEMSNHLHLSFFPSLPPPSLSSFFPSPGHAVSSVSTKQNIGCTGGMCVEELVAMPPCLVCSIQPVKGPGLFPFPMPLANSVLGLLNLASPSTIC